MLMRVVLYCLAALPGAYAFLQQDKPPKAEDVFAKIEVFKGLPASEIIPVMEFMCASMKYSCNDCHKKDDYAAETQAKAVTRKMVLLQRDINQRHFDGKLEVTCMTCHNGKEHPVAMPLPGDARLRHGDLEPMPEIEKLFSKHIAAMGNAKGMIVRTGTLTAPNDETHKVETLPCEFTQAEGGKFRIVSGKREIISNGKQISYDGVLMSDEPAAFFGRIGRAWRGADAFDGLTDSLVAGKNSIGSNAVVVVRGNRISTKSYEDIWFNTTGSIARLVNIRPTQIGTVVSSIDYSNYKTVGSVRVPMNVVVTLADGNVWKMSFTSAKAIQKVDETLFKIEE